MNPAECLKALGRAHTYNFRKNGCLRVGVLVGLIVSALPVLGEGILSGAGGGNPLDLIRTQPFRVLFLANPVVFGLIFGAMGTMKRDLDLLHHEQMTLLSELAMTDPLTGLYNRRYVEEELKNLLHRVGRTGTPVSVVFFDVDHFKDVNRKEGHRGGDLMLKRIAEALRSSLRQGEILGRYGGDEFLLVVSADLPYATKVVERAVAAVKASTGKSLSAGVSRSGEDGTTPEELIAAADARLGNAQEKHHVDPPVSGPLRV